MEKAGIIISQAARKKIPSCTDRYAIIHNTLTMMFTDTIDKNIKKLLPKDYFLQISRLYTIIINHVYSVFCYRMVMIVCYVVKTQKS